MALNKEYSFGEEWIKIKLCELSQEKYSITEYFIAKILQNDDGSLIVLESDTNLIEIFFDGYVALLRNCNEGLRLRTIQDIQTKYGQFYLVDSLLYKVKNSGLSKWAEEECYGRYEADELFHFCIVTLNDLVDVLATFEPNIKIKKLTDQS